MKPSILFIIKTIRSLLEMLEGYQIFRVSVKKIMLYIINFFINVMYWYKNIRWDILTFNKIKYLIEYLNLLQLNQLK